MLRTFADSAEKKTVVCILSLQLAACAIGMLVLSPCAGVAAFVGAAGAFACYRYRSYREFGGITGDTAGYFVLLCEVVIVIAAAAGSRLI